MSPQQRKQLQKKLKHRKALKNHLETVAKKRPRYEKYHQHNVDDYLLENHYFPKLDTEKINHYYQKIIDPMVEKIKQHQFNNDFNEKDNRTLLNDFNYDYVEAFDHYRYFNGFVTDYRIIKKETDRPRIYLLISEVQGLIQGLHDREWHGITDHLWIDINDFKMRISHDHKATIGLGDYIMFIAHIKTYRGYRENIHQTKTGVKDIVILNYGYPYYTIKSDISGKSGDIAFNQDKCLHYNHHDQYLIQIDPEPITITFGKQIRTKDSYCVRDFTNRYINDHYFDQTFFDHFKDLNQVELRKETKND